LHAIRGTGEAEKQLKNAKSEYSEEAEEIATYSAIETLAESVGDAATVKLAREIRREEERMLSYLAKEIPRFARAVAKAEIPASLRNGGASAKRSSGRRAAKPAAGRTRAASATGAKAKSTKTRAKGATATAKARTSRAPAKARTRVKATTGAKGARSR
jgi:hypothetical protein